MKSVQSIIYCIIESPCNHNHFFLQHYSGLERKTTAASRLMISAVCPTFSHHRIRVSEPRPTPHRDMTITKGRESRFPLLSLRFIFLISRNNLLCSRLTFIIKRLPVSLDITAKVCAHLSIGIPPESSPTGSLLLLLDQRQERPINSKREPQRLVHSIWQRPRRLFCRAGIIITGHRLGLGVSPKGSRSQHKVKCSELGIDRPW